MFSGEPGLAAGRGAGDGAVAGAGAGQTEGGPQGPAGAAPGESPLEPPGAERRSVATPRAVPGRLLPLVQNGPSRAAPGAGPRQGHPADPGDVWHPGPQGPG